MFWKSIVDENVTVVKVEEKTTAMRTTKISRNSMFSGGESYAKSVFIVTLKKENGEEFTLSASENMVLGLTPGLTGTATYSNNRLRAFKR